MSQMSQSARDRSVLLCRYPYPYQAMMAVCSDLDRTPDQWTYREIIRFLNTTDVTSMGPGVGLEVGNSIYFDMPPDQFSYWGTDDAGRKMIQVLIRSGHIDCLHSYGDLAETRDQASRAIDELDKHGCKLAVWVDHRKSPTNFGHDITAGSGDIAGSRAYHADISAAFGITYVWRGRTTGLLGQNAPVHPRLFASMFQPRHPLLSGRTLTKEAVKVLLGYMNRPRWQLHARNTACQIGSLRDGRAVWEFLRADPYCGGQSSIDTGDLIGRVLTKRNLDMLVTRRAVWIHYTHLGKVQNPRIPFGEPTQNAFRLLAGYHNGGKILVTTTHRLLRYLVTRDWLRYRIEKAGNAIFITIDAVDDPVRGTRVPSLDELQGITFEARGRMPIRLRLCSSTVDLPIRIESTGGRTYASIPWQSLALPPL